MNQRSVDHTVGGRWIAQADRDHSGTITIDELREHSNQSHQPRGGARAPPSAAVSAASSMRLQALEAKVDELLQGQRDLQQQLAALATSIGAAPRSKVA